MPRTGFLVVIFICLVGLLTPVSAHEHDPPRITAVEVMQMIDRGEPFIFLDVRTDAAISSSEIMLPGAIQLNTRTALQEYSENADKTAMYVTYCT